MTRAILTLKDVKLSDLTREAMASPAATERAFAAAIDRARKSGKEGDGARRLPRAAPERPLTGLPDYPWENPGDDLDDLDLSAALDAHTARRHAAEAAGRAAFLAGIPVEKAPNQDYEHWRVGWFTARNERSQAFESYIKHQTLFDRQYCPPAYRGDPKAFAQLQEKRQQWIARIAVEFPEIPAAYAKWKKHKEGK